MNFIRPELAAWLTRWREPIIWGVLLVFGILLILRGFAQNNFLSLFSGGAAALTAVLLLHGAFLHARLARLPLGKGVVVVDEGRVVLLGPKTGGVIDVADLARIEVVPGSDPVWRLHSFDGEVLEIPMAAKGADQLVDALGILPGFDFKAGLSVIADSRNNARTIWQSDVSQNRLALRQRPHFTSR